MKEKKFRPITILFLGFLVMILTGSLLLFLPWAHNEGVHTKFIDALFVSASASCVTGLTPFNTAEHWSLFGQIVILILIQIGGLGFMTFITLISWFIKKDIGLYNKSIVMQSAGTFSFGSVKPLLRKIIIGTILFEVLGACILLIAFYPTYGSKGIWYAFFTSISAFCNAGFDLFNDSLVEFNSNPAVILTISSLIILGGLGFLVWDDIWDSKFKFSKFQMHTKIVLVFTGFLVVIPTILFYIFEFTKLGNPGILSDSGMSFGERILNSFFLAVTPRTAGFYSVDMSQLTPAGRTLSVILMFMGGNSGSTAGGVKVTTFVVVIANLFATARGKDETTLFKQSITADVTKQASSLLIAYLSVSILAVMIIASIEPFTFDQIIFESISAIATVGLTLGITSSLSIGSKIVLILLMYIGRLGAFALFNLIVGKTNRHAIKHSEGRIMVG